MFEREQRIQNFKKAISLLNEVKALALDNCEFAEFICIEAELGEALLNIEARMRSLSFFNKDMRTFLALLNNMEASNSPTPPEAA